MSVATPPSLATPGRGPEPDAGGPQTYVVQRTSHVSPDLAELWRYRELLFFFVWRDLKVRYRQTVLGAAWAVLQPFVTMVVFSVFLGHFVGVPSDGLPYPVFAFAALVPWTFVAQGVSQSANSLVGSQSLIKKVYFPRLVIPLGAVISGLADFAVAFVVLLALMAYFGLLPGIQIVWVPLLLLQALVTALAVGLWLSALNVRYRDIRYVVPFLIQVWLFATPVAYPSSLLHEPWRTLYALNPMVGVIEGFRWALLGTGAMPGRMMLVSTAVVVVVLVTGVFHFRRAESTFADVV